MWTLSLLLYTYLIVDVLLLRQDRSNWKVVEQKVRSSIRAELIGIRNDVTFLSGAQDIVLVFPSGATREQEERFVTREHLKEARRLSGNLEAVRQKGLERLNGVKDLFDYRADKIASFQLRYWSRLLEPELMAFLIDLEDKLRRVQLSLDLLRKYKSFPEPSERWAKDLQGFQISSSQETLYQDMQGLLSLMVDGVDKGFVPVEDDVAPESPGAPGHSASTPSRRSDVPPAPQAAGGEPDKRLKLVEIILTLAGFLGVIDTLQAGLMVPIARTTLSLLIVVFIMFALFGYVSIATPLAEDTAIRVFVVGLSATFSGLLVLPLTIPFTTSTSGIFTLALPQFGVMGALLLYFGLAFGLSCVLYFLLMKVVILSFKRLAPKR